MLTLAIAIVYRFSIWPTPNPDLHYRAEDSMHRDLIFINGIFEWLEVESPEVYRILHIDFSFNKIIVIKLATKRLEISALDYDHFEKMFDSHKIRFIKYFLHKSYNRPDALLSEKAQKRRDEAYGLIEEIVCKVPDIFDSQKRGQMIKDLAQTSQRPITTIYNYVRIFLQGGQCPNALVFDFHKQGGLGKERIFTDEHQKPGRFNEDGEHTGVKKTQEIVNAFEYGKELLESGKAKTHIDALRELNTKFFSVGYEEEDGNLVPILPPEDELPNIKQFRFYLQGNLDLAEVKKAAIGENSFNANHRSMHGDSTTMAFAPGSIFGYDCTTVNCYLVSRLDSTRILRRLTLAIGVDFFSHAVVAAQVSLKKESWETYKLAFENTVTDKVLLCEQYKISITKDQWPCAGLSSGALIDRGGAYTKQCEQLRKVTGIDFTVLPPYRPDLKGVVEQLLDIIDELLAGRVPARVPKKRHRGEKDYRLEACLNIDEFINLLLRAIVHYNNFQYIRDYPSDIYMITDRVNKIPNDLWLWGLKNRGCFLKTIDRDTLRYNLLPTSYASITRNGIFFNGIYYECTNSDIQKRILTAAVTNRREEVRISHNPNTKVGNDIYLHLRNGELEPCHPTDNKKTNVFIGYTFWEVEKYRTSDAKAAQSQEALAQQDLAKFDSHSDALVKPAMERTKQAVKDSGLSKNARIKNINENTRAEMEFEQEKLNQPDITSEPNSNEPEQTLPSIKSTESVKRDHVARPSYANLLSTLNDEDDSED